MASLAKTQLAGSDLLDDPVLYSEAIDSFTLKALCSPENIALSNERLAGYAQKQPKCAQPFLLRNRRQMLAVDSSARSSTAKPRYAEAAERIRRRTRFEEHLKTESAEDKTRFRSR